jgi:hypothetical protein
MRALLRPAILFGLVALVLGASHSCGGAIRWHSRLRCASAQFSGGPSGGARSSLRANRRAGCAGKGRLPVHACHRYHLFTPEPYLPI